MKAVLVTGGTGFVGTHVVDALLLAGYKVRVMGTRPMSQRSEGQVEFFQGDVRHKEDWRKSIQGVDAVIHLAAYLDAHPDISRYTHTNIESVAMAFEAILEERAPVKVFNLASSQILYGEGRYSCPKHGTVFPPPRTAESLMAGVWELACPECSSSIRSVPTLESDPTSPQSAYALSKLGAEELAFLLGKKYGIFTTALRYAAVIGDRSSARQRVTGAIGSFVSDALAQHPIQLNEDGQQLRDFVHVKDVARAHVQVLEDARANGQIFNVGSGQATRVIDLAKTVAEVVGVKFVSQLSGRSDIDVPRHALMDISKLERLGYQPTYSLKDMVYDYVQGLN